MEDGGGEEVERETEGWHMSFWIHFIKNIEMIDPIKDTINFLKINLIY